jgi:hypothetical protein
MLPGYACCSLAGYIGYAGWLAMLYMVHFGYDNCAARLNMLVGWLCFLNWLA